MIAGLCTICGHPLPPPLPRGRPRDYHKGPCAELAKRISLLESAVGMVEYTPQAARGLRKRLVREVVNRIVPLCWERPRGARGRFLPDTKGGQA